MVQAPGQPLRFVQPVENSGPTPAAIYGSDTAIVALKNEVAADTPAIHALIDRFNASQKHVGTDYTIGPGHGINLHNDSGELITDKDMEKWRSGQVRVLVMVRVYYRDREGEEHETRAVYMTKAEPSGQLMLYEYGSHMD
jgi:hypothetical protein